MNEKGLSTLKICKQKFNYLNYSIMTTRKDLQEWLNRFPEDTIIEFGIQQSAGAYQSYGNVEFDTPKLEDNDIGDGWEFVDFRDNKFVKPDAEYFGKCYLRIGESR